MSVMNGFRQELLGRILGLNGDLGIYAAGAPLTGFDDIVKRVRGLPGVVGAMPVVEGQALLTTERGGAQGGIVRGMRQSDLRSLHVVSDNIRAGTLDNFQGDDAVAIGLGLAQRLGLGIGSKLTLVSPQGQATVIGTVPRIRAYSVAAIFQVGFNEADTSFVYLPLEAAQLFFRVPDGATEIEVMVRDPDQVAAVNREIRNGYTGPPARVIDWTQSNNSLFAAVQVERNVMFLILLVAAFNVVSSLIMMVKDKTRDIAVLRTLGASSGSVMRIFLMCGASVGIAGTVVGALLGIVFCLNIETIRHWLENLTGTNLFNPEIYFLSQLPAVLQWQEVAQVVGMALVLSLLATLYPSCRTAPSAPRSRRRAASDRRRAAPAARHHRCGRCAARRAVAAAHS
jgi:lipoprotein-releasing system permease protein